MFVWKVRIRLFRYVVSFSLFFLLFLQASHHLGFPFEKTGMLMPRNISIHTTQPRPSGKQYLQRTNRSAKLLCTGQRLSIPLWKRSYNPPHQSWELPIITVVLIEREERRVGEAVEGRPRFPPYNIKKWTGLLWFWWGKFNHMNFAGVNNGLALRGRHIFSLIFLLCKIPEWNERAGAYH